MNLKLIAPIGLLFGLLAASGVQAQQRVCDEQSHWLKSVPSDQRDWVLLKVSSNTAHKFFEVISTPNVKPQDELWGYKILAIGHHILSQSPYASPQVKSVLSRVEVSTSGMIRGEVSYSSFRSQLESSDKTISTMMAKAESGDRTFMQQYKTEVERLSNCVILTAMNSASPKQ